MIAYKYVIFDSRDNMLQMYRGQRTFFQDVTVSPANLVVGYYASASSVALLCAIVRVT